MYHIILKLYIDIINQVEKPPDYLIFFQQMLQFRVILYPFHFIRDNLLDFLLDPDEMERIKNDPNLQHLIKTEE